MNEPFEPAILGVCLENTLDTPMGDFLHADSAHRALELLRLMRFELLLTGDRLADMPLETFIVRVKRTWPWQRWVLVTGSSDHRQELLARSLGVMAVIDAPLRLDELLEITRNLRPRQAGPSVRALMSTHAGRALSGSSTG